MNMSTFTTRRDFSVYDYYVDEYGKEILHGEYKSFHPFTLKLHIRCFYKHGKLHGEYKCWHSNGQLCLHCFYLAKNLSEKTVTDIIVGEDKKYDENGHLIYRDFHDSKGYMLIGYKFIPSSVDKKQSRFQTLEI